MVASAGRRALTEPLKNRPGDVVPLGSFPAFNLRKSADKSVSPDCKVVVASAWRKGEVSHHVFNLCSSAKSAEQSIYPQITQIYADKTQTITMKVLYRRMKPRVKVLRTKPLFFNLRKSAKSADKFDPQI
jgi:hypothetical protein